jgi:hypothetical protein
MHHWWSLSSTVVVAAVTSAFTFWIQERKLRAELRTEYMAEAAVKRLLMSPKWTKRSIEEIERRVGGFERLELQKILVRAGAVRFSGEAGSELWGLIDRNEKDLT